MIEDRPWCSAAAEARGDPMLGTAFPASRILLVEQPGSWGRGGLRDSDFPTAVVRELETRSQARGIRVQAIRRVGRTARSGELRWGFADVAASGDRMAWGVYRDPAELLDLDVDELDADESRPVFLVCAHGKHDPCCAMRGRPVAAELERAAPGQVWETSHLGGDRFAANVLVLPSGIVYGRVTPEAIAGVVVAAEADEIVLPLLRGQVGLAPAAQAAVGFAHDHVGTSRRGAVRFVSSRPSSDGRVQAVVRGPDRTLQVTLRPERRTARRLTCHAPGAGSYLTYLLEGIEPVDRPD